MSDIALEVIRAMVLFGIVVFVWNAGRERFELFRLGWNLIIAGFVLLLFGSVLDITDNFENLNRFVVIGDTEWEAILEKFVGFLGGFILLAIGLIVWIPKVQELSDLVKSRTENLQQAKDRAEEIEASLQENEVHLTSILDNLPAALYLKDTSGRFLVVSSEFVNRRSITKQEILGKTAHELDGVLKGDADKFAAQDRKVIETRQVTTREQDIVYAGGEARTHRVTKFPVIDSLGKVIGVGGFAFDITESKLAERAKREFVSIVSHELRTPLTSIKGSLGLVRSGATGGVSEEHKSMLEIAYNNSERLIHLINDILDIEKIEVGKMEFQMERVELALLLDQALEANKNYGNDRGISFTLTNDAQNALITGDINRLMRVFSNLMSNAAKFSPEGGGVEMSVAQDGNAIRIAVKDNGPGISEEYSETIFDKFTQVDSSNTRSKGGTGLGLSISKAIVEEHGGTIWFESVLGVGSTFYFTLPVAE